MKFDVANWKHKSGEPIWYRFLDLFKYHPLSDEEFDFILDNSSDNIRRHAASHYNPVRECLNSVHHKNKREWSIAELKEFENKFISQKKINFKSFLNRIQSAPMEEAEFQRMVEASNTTKDLSLNGQNIVKVANKVRIIANMIHSKPQFASLPNRLEDLQSSESVKADFEIGVTQSYRLRQRDRLERLKHTNKIPEIVVVKRVEFKRNPDVVAESLYRANGKCEKCRKPAPFLRKTDGTPYLEVHHKIMLADGGEDTLDNVLAICANCHRELHFG